MTFFHTRKGILISTIVLLIVMMSGLIINFELKYANKFYPHTVVAGEDVSGKTYQEVFGMVEEKAGSLEKDGFLVQVSSSTMKIPSFSPGLTPDTVVEYFKVGDYKTELAKAYRLGRHGALFERIWEQLNLAFSYNEVKFPYTLQEDAVRSLVSNSLDSILKKKNEAQFRTSNGWVEIIPDNIGETADQEEIIIGLKYSLATLGSAGITAPVKSDLPVVTTKRLEVISDFVRELAQKSQVEAKFDGFTTYISGLKLAGWITLKDEPGISIVINKEKLEAYVRANVDPYVADAPRNSRFEMRDGVLVEIVTGLPGQAVDISSFYNQLNEAISNMHLENAVPIKLSVGLITEAPRVTKDTISIYGIKDLVGTVKTSFKGGTANRIHNITTGLSKINGLLLAPGQEFSAVNAIGVVDEASGYVEELVIKADATVKEFGGGLCQIATTLFRLALNAGFPVTERVNHRYVVGYYGPGLDATIYGPHPDLKFVNDTKGYLLLQGRIVDQTLILELYGQKDGRIATVTEPIITDRIPPPPPKYIPAFDMPLGTQKCTERAIYGVTSDVTYSVTYPDGRLAIQDFHSIYQPWAQVCLVGIALNR